MVKDLQRCNKSYYRSLVYGHCASKMYISAECRYSDRPPRYSLQNATAVHLGVSQPICVVALTGLLDVQGRKSKFSPSIYVH